jgi:hypothetical protein
LGKHKPHNGEGLEGVVHWDKVENDVDEGLSKVEEPKDDPVSKPVEKAERQCQENITSLELRATAAEESFGKNVPLDVILWLR